MYTWHNQTTAHVYPTSSYHPHMHRPLYCPTWILYQSSSMYILDRFLIYIYFTLLGQFTHSVSFEDLKPSNNIFEKNLLPWLYRRNAKEIYLLFFKYRPTHTPLLNHWNRRTMRGVKFHCRGGGTGRASGTILQSRSNVYGKRRNRWPDITDTFKTASLPLFTYVIKPQRCPSVSFRI